ncbi:MAG: hypothetical protein EZS28_019714 [Streblomastix strix]|uniref:Uncharacterized protein n=1 Tax=Streblomastix strix TaxID=222440 RepID=A0A5J4VQX5_9EUKA|nr:MAG: hypothetical protein EZS28_019714 [Streblomastix strix]
MRARNIEANLRKIILNRLKKWVEIEKDIEETVAIIDIFCGLACQKSNIPAIVSNNFIQNMTKFAQSPEENIQSYTLELFLILAENEVGIDPDIRQAVDEYGLLDITGTFGLEVDYRAFVQTQKWGNKKLLNTISKIINLRDLYDQSTAKKRQQILDEEMFSILYQILIEAEKEVSKSQQLGKKVPSLTLGIISNLCAFLGRVLQDHVLLINYVMQTGIPKVLIQILNNIPKYQIKGIHINAIYSLAPDGFDSHSQQIYLLGAMQFLGNAITKPNSTMNVVNSLIDLQNLVSSGLQVTNKQSQITHELSLKSQHPYFTDLQNNGFLNTLEQCMNDYSDNAKICLYASRVFTILYKGRVIPPQRLRIIISSLKRSLKSKSTTKQAYFILIDSIKFVAIQSDNHWALTEYKILQTLVSTIMSSSLKDQQEIFMLLQIIFEVGNDGMRQQVRDIMPEDKLWSLVDKKMYSLQFNKVADFGAGFQHNSVFSSFLLNESVLSLLVWYIEDKRMDQIQSIIGQLELDRKEEIIERNIEDDKWKRMKNKWDQLKKILQLVSEIKDLDLSVGAMVLVRGGVNSIYFRIPEEGINEEIASISLSALNRISSEIDGFLLYNLISSQICKWIAFILDECKRNILSITIKEQAVQYSAYVAIRGKQMAQLMEVNRFSIPFFEGKLDEALMKIILEKTKKGQQTKDTDQINKEIKLKAAIAYCCCRVQVGLEESALNTIVDLFCQQLKSLMILIQQYSQALQSNSSQQSNKDDIQEIDIKQIENTRDVLYSISSLGIEIEIVEKLINTHKIHDYIFPLIHINCTCPQSIKVPNSVAISNLISVAYFALKDIWHTIPNDQRTVVNLQHTPLKHITSLILSFSEQINANLSKQPSEFSISQTSESNCISPELMWSAICYLCSLVFKHSFAKQLIEESNVIECIVKFASMDIIPGVNSTDNINIILYSSEVIQYISKSADSILIYKLIHQLNIIKYLSKHACSPGGGGIDNDDIIGSSLRIFTNILKNLEKKKSISKEKQLLDDAKEMIEEQGLVQEDDAMIYYYDKRRAIGVVNSAYGLQQQLRY